MKSKDDMIFEIVDSWCDAMGLDDLIEFYKAEQENYLSKFNDDEIEKKYRSIVHDATNAKF